MKVRNKGRIVWPKGMELDKDLPTGAEGAVLPDAESNDRLRNAIDSGVLEVVTAELTHVITPGGIVQTVVGDEPFKSLTGSNEAIGPRKSGEVRRSAATSTEVAELQEQEQLSELAEFKRRKGGAKVKYVKQMRDLSALRAVLGLSKGAKVLAAAQARIEELVGAAKPPEELLDQAALSAEDLVKRAEGRRPKTPKDLLG